MSASSAKSSLLVVGLTGGIASGKSSVGKLFETHGVPVLDADQSARDVVAPGTDGLDAVIDAFGPSVLGADGSLDRAALRREIFGQDERRRALEQIIHPRVRSHMHQWVAEQQSADVPYCMLMIPLLVESGLQALTRKVVVVDVPVDVQRSRLMHRDDIDAALADQMIAAQASRAERLEAANWVIDNSGARDELPPQVARVHDELIGLTSR